MQQKLIDLAEVKFAAIDTATKTFSGYGAVFNNVDAANEILAPGAFAKSLASNRQPLMFLNHDIRSLPIGKWTSLEEDAYGLKVTGEFLDTTTGQDAYKASKAGAISGLSIGYIPREVIAGKGSGPRTLKSVDLFEVSVVTIPCNDLARIADVKMLDDADDFERELIRHGMTLAEAKDFLAGHVSAIEHKYLRAAELETARKLLSKLQGEK